MTSYLGYCTLKTNSLYCHISPPYPSSVYIFNLACENSEVFYLPPVAKGHCWEIMKGLPYVRASVHPFVMCLLKTLISHSFVKIFSPNLQGMFVAMKTCLCKNFGLIWKNKMVAIANCLKIIKVL